MKPRLTFGVMADCQFADADPTEAIVPGTNGHHYDNQFRFTPGKLRQAVTDFNSHSLDFVIHLGDFIDRNLDDADTLLDITKDLKAPLWHVLGNHDYMGSEGHAQRVYEKYGLKKGYYTQIIAGYRLIVLDTNELGVIKYPEGSTEWKAGRQLLDLKKDQGHIQAYDWNGGVGEEQLAWLDMELTAADNAAEKVILFAHHPVFPPGSLNALDDDAVLNVIDRHSCVIAFMNGHNHIGDFGERQHIPYVTIPAMLQGKTNAYGIVRVTDEKLEIEGYGRVDSMTMRLPA